MPVDNLPVCISKGELRGIGENGVERAERTNLVGIRFVRQQIADY